MKIALAQINTTVGDLDGNRDRIVGRIRDARAGGAELVVFPELAITGYPPEDLLLRPAFVDASQKAVREVAEAATGIVALVGAPHAEDGKLYNACLVCADGEVSAVYRKRLLPNYGVFDEKRYFEPGEDAAMLAHGGRQLGLTVWSRLLQRGRGPGRARV
jgi:NAD+ synthase (glutamine-hydrolysing)